MTNSLEKYSPQIDGELFLFPEPNISAEDSLRLRFSFRNDQNFYHNTCASSGTKLISIYSPDKNIPVLSDEAYWSDNFNPLKYGRDFDFSRSFFEQFKELKDVTPRLANFHTQSENSEYTVHSSRNKNCYLGSSLVDCENVLYSDICLNSKSCLDQCATHDMELCYQCIHSEKCYNSDYIELSSGLIDCFLCLDCRSSSNLLGCVGLRTTENMILNSKVSKAEVHDEIIKIKTDRVYFQQFYIKYLNLLNNSVRPAEFLINSENCSGNLIFNSKNLHNCYGVFNSEDCCYYNDGESTIDSRSISRVADGELLYECSGIVNLKYSAFCNLCYQANNLLYCDNCQAGSSNCFGSMSLKRNQYVILNKQYTEPEYYKLLKKIIKHMQDTEEWGSFFPPGLSPFAYNETKACNVFPLNQAKAQELGYSWKDVEAPENNQGLSANNLSSDVSKISQKELNSVFKCQISDKLFKLNDFEIQFYRQKQLTPPLNCPSIRHKERSEKYSHHKMYSRFCENCGDNIRTVYSTDDPYRVFCSKCYLENLY